jgi:hypothetical protein
VPALRKKQSRFVPDLLHEICRWLRPYSLRGRDRYACSARVTNGSCANTRTIAIARADLEQRVLAGLEDRMMAPDMVAEAMRAYADGGSDPGAG